MFKIQDTSWRAFIVSIISLFVVSCSVSKQISKSANEVVLTNKALVSAHVGLSIFDPAENKYLYNYQGDKYFVPASNVKIPTCYAAMKYLGDSLIGVRYLMSPGMSDIILYPNGDPTFLLREFKFQPVLDFLNKNKRPVLVNTGTWKAQPLGSGWAWNDYEAYYMAERSLMPIYGNMIQFSGTVRNLKIFPQGLPDSLHLISSENGGPYLRNVARSRTGNNYTLTMGATQPATIEVTFDTHNALTKLLADTLKTEVVLYYSPLLEQSNLNNLSVIRTQPTDSMLKPLMHRSDNFFAEQSLLMVSNAVLGFMNDSRIIDTLLKADFKDLPQRPRWADGSGLSRYNLFTPQDFVAILNKMKNEFGMDRLKVIMATGGEGTISSYYKADSTFIYGKTGTLSGVVAFSGFMYTKKGKLLIFSTLVNNHQATATDVRRAIEKFLQGIRARY